MAGEEKALTEEEVFANDVDPLDAIRELRARAGASEEELAEIVDDDDTGTTNTPSPDEPEPGADELAALDKGEPKPDDAGEVTGKIIEDPEDPTESEEDRKARLLVETDKEHGKIPAAEGEEEELTDEQKQEAADKATTEAAKTPGPLKFRANGKDFEFTQDEILGQFETVFGQAMDYTKKMQEIAPYRKMISALETEGITQAQLNTAIDALKGDKGAIAKIMEDNKIESYDLTPDADAAPYAPGEYGKNESQLNIESVVSKIQEDPEYKITVDVIDNQWDQTSREAIASNPSMIQGLHNDIKQGIYDEVAPAAMKMKVLDGNTKSDIEYYMLAGEQRRVRLQQQNAEKTVDDLNKPAQDAADNFDEASSEAARKRAAGATRTRADRKGVVDYLDDDDEAYDAWYKKVMASN